MKYSIDARSLACPQPVLLTQKALKEHREIIVIVDNDTAAENVRRMGIASGCTVDIKKETNGTIHLHLLKKEDEVPEGTPSQFPAERENDTRVIPGPSVVVIASDRMGRGEDDELGKILMRSFIHTLLEVNPRPDTLIFYNTGVRLTVKDSPTLDDLTLLEESGVTILVCGTCLNYFGLTDARACGVMSNMYDIASAMAGAGKLIVP